MKKSLSLILISLFMITASAQNNVKTGWKFGGALPTTTFSTDLGFQYGAFVEFYNYGDGSRFPDFFDHTYTEVSHFTKGSGIFRMMYESNHLIPGVHMTSDLSYLPDAATDFYGFNGYEAVYNSDWMKYDDTPSDPYKSAMFYRFQRNQFRFKNDFQGKLSGEHINWSAGFAFQKFKVSSVNIDKLNKGRKDILPTVTEQPGLYELYRDSLGLISANEADGGWVNTLKFGVEWDSRDNKPNPMKGMWTEMGVELSPKFMGSDWGFARLYFIHRQYFTLIPRDLAFVYRVDYQSTISGSVPFFYQSQVVTSRLTGATNEGLGGASTLRGVLRNRVLGDGFVYANIELRWKPVHFSLLNQDCYIGLSAFYDFGMITRKIKLPSDLETTFSENMKNYAFQDFFNPGGEKLHQDAGISIFPVINQNFVIAIDIGKAFNAQDGNIGFSIGLNYLF